jgi:hypothetical protein
MPNDAFETTDGSRPHFFGLAEAVQRAHPLAAFALLEAGDAFESLSGAPPRDGGRAAAQTVADFVFERHGATEAHLQRVQSDLVRVLSGNPALSHRLRGARPLSVELLPARPAWTRFGFPASTSPNTSGLFWDDERWPSARLALRQDRLDAEPHLVFHELAHALAYLAFTKAELTLLHRRFLPVYRAEVYIDEAFAVYTEREFIDGYRPEDERAPGIYGHARRRWSEDHLLTRFVRHLYFPFKPLAGGRVR